MMSWGYLIAAIICEIAWLVILKFNQKHPGGEVPTECLYIIMSLNILMLRYATQRIDFSIAYPIWTGLAGAVVCGVAILVFQEAWSYPKLCYTVLIGIGVVGLASLQKAPAHETIGKSAKLAPIEKTD